MSQKRKFLLLGALTTDTQYIRILRDFLHAVALEEIL